MDTPLDAPLDAPVLTVSRDIKLIDADTPNFAGLDFETFRLHDRSKIPEGAIKIAMAPAAAAMFDAGMAAIKGERYQEAIRLFSAVCRATPNLFPAHSNLAMALDLGGRRKDAIAVMAGILSIFPREAHGWFHLGMLYALEEQHPLAAVCCHRASALEPNNSRFAWDRSQYFLSIGDFVEGWKGAESRLAAQKDGRFMREPFPPYLENIEQAKDKTLLVWPEQGIGDQMMCLGLIEEAQKICKHLILEIDDRLMGIARRSFPGIEVYSSWRNGARVDAHKRADYQIPIMNLAIFFRRKFEDFPDRGTPTLKVDTEIENYLRARYEKLAAGRPIIGLSWQSHRKGRSLQLGRGHSHDKSIPLEDLAEIYENKNAFFVSLQFSEWQAGLPMDGGLIYRDPAVDYYRDYDIPLAQVAAMDLVVTISNTTLHTAGGLNIPTTAIINNGKTRHWYWFLRRHDCPWYPSVTLFRPEPETDNGKWYATSVKRIAAQIRTVSDP